MGADITALLPQSLCNPHWYHGLSGVLLLPRPPVPFSRSRWGFLTVWWQCGHEFGTPHSSTWGWSRPWGTALLLSRSSNPAVPIDKSPTAFSTQHSRDATSPQPCSQGCGCTSQPKAAQQDPVQASLHLHQRTRRLPQRTKCTPTLFPPPPAQDAPLHEPQRTPNPPPNPIPIPGVQSGATLSPHALHNAE